VMKHDHNLRALWGCGLLVFSLRGGGGGAGGGVGGGGGGGGGGGVLSAVL